MIRREPAVLKELRKLRASLIVAGMIFVLTRETPSCFAHDEPSSRVSSQLPLCPTCSRGSRLPLQLGRAACYTHVGEGRLSGSKLWNMTQKIAAQHATNGAGVRCRGAAAGGAGVCWCRGGRRACGWRAGTQRSLYPGQGSVSLSQPRQSVGNENLNERGFATGSRLKAGPTASMGTRVCDKLWPLSWRSHQEMGI